MRSPFALGSLFLALSASSAVFASSFIPVRSSNLAARSSSEESSSSWTSVDEFTKLSPDEYLAEFDEDGEFLGHYSDVIKRASSTSSYADEYYFDDTSVTTACKRWRCKCINYVPTNTELTFTSVSCTNADSSAGDTSGEALAYCLFTSSSTGTVQSVNQHVAANADFYSCD